MKRFTVILLCFAARAVSAADDLPLDASHPAKQHAPAHAKATLRLPASVMIGEDIPAHLIIQNTGSSVFEMTLGGDYRSTGYPQRMKVRVQDAAMQTLPELPREAFGVGGGGMMAAKTIELGVSESIEFPLECYVSFTKPGVYTVIAGHDLGWIVDKAHPHPIGQAKLTVTEPTEAEAAAYMKKIFDGQPTTAPRDESEKLGREMRLEKRLSTLRHPAYLSALDQRATAGSSAAVKGIGHIVGTKATDSLVKLLNHDSAEIIETSARQILRRLPAREDASKRAIPSFWDSRYQIDPLLPSSWHVSFEQPLTESTVKMLAHSETGVVEMAGFFMKARGEAEHAPAILDALQKSLDVYQPPRSGSGANTLDPPRPQKFLIESLDALRQRGWRTDGSGGTAHILAWCRQLADEKIERPKGDRWQESLRVWCENGPATLRICALQAIPHPATAVWDAILLKALDDPDRGVMRVACETAGKSKRPEFVRPLVQIVETAHETFLQNAANNAAVACGARCELWNAWTVVILDQERMYPALSALVNGTIKLPPSNAGGGNSNFNRDQRFAIRNAWREFLKENHKELTLGKRIPVTDAATIAGLTGLKFQPDDPAVEIHFKDGTHWPPRARK